MDIQLLGALVFASVFALDLVWAMYTRALMRDRHWAASLLAGGIFLLNGLATLAYVDSAWLLIPAVMGAIAGTYAGSRITSR